MFRSRAQFKGHRVVSASLSAVDAKGCNFSKSGVAWIRIPTSRSMVGISRRFYWIRLPKRPILPNKFEVEGFV